MERSKPADDAHIEPGSRAAAPGRLEHLQRFVNTWNREYPVDQDQLGTPTAAAAWLRQSDLVPDRPRNVTLDQADVLLLCQLREAIRAMVTATATGTSDSAALDVIRVAAAAAPVIVAIDDGGRTHLEPNRSDVHGAVATLLTIMHEAQLTGAWARLKGCRQCGYAFFDLSKNRSATWCSMSICGNRAKNRAYYQRHRSSVQPKVVPPAR